MTSLPDHLASYPNSWSQYQVPSWSSLYSANVVELRIDIAKIMVVQKQSLPSFASIIAVLSIVFYCAGFLRVELELNKQKKRMNALESVTEAMSPSNDADLKIIKNAAGMFFFSDIGWSWQVTIKRYNFKNERFFQLHICKTCVSQQTNHKSQMNICEFKTSQKINVFLRVCLCYADAMSELKVNRSCFL